jgi:hypothetical protein
MKRVDVFAKAETQQLGGWLGRIVLLLWEMTMDAVAAVVVTTGYTHLPSATYWICIR